MANDTGREGLNRQGVDETPSTAEELEGNQITQEQIRDVYFAGTSDGIVVLNKGKTVHIDADSADAER